MKPMVEAIGLGWTDQLECIKRHPVLQTCIRVTRMQVSGDRQTRDPVLATRMFVRNIRLFDDPQARP